MNFFKKLFAGNKEKEISSTAVPQNQSEEFKNLFVDSSEPGMKEIEEVNVLKIFFEQDFFQTGFKEGYYFHNTGLLESGIMKITSEYQHLLSLKLEELKQEIYRLEDNKLTCTGLPGSISERIAMRIETINAALLECNSELVLSEAGSGAIKLSITKYKDGFIKGANQYANENLLGGNIGLFN